MRLMSDLHKQVNAATVDPGFIVSERKKLALDQREAAKFLVATLAPFRAAKTAKPIPH